ncbi:type I glyceraldehyde-3-phosphate dehydrogenase [bacterium]|nr:type I glyceraldehyde-3-phosphate dehydrogenase [bacterium]
MAKIRLGINGFGRIGRQVARIASSSDEIDLVAFNDLCDAKTNAHLFKYDSTYGRFNGTIELKGDEFIINGDAVKLLSIKDPAELPWGDLGVDFVLESTGVFRTVETCNKHLEAGAKQVLLSAPAKGEMPTYVMGVNHLNWAADGKPKIISNASCTTNCLAPVAKVLNDNYTIKRGLMNTIHAYTNDQRILDQLHSDLRRARSAAVNIIPTTTGAAKAVGLVIPDLKGKVDGFATRVPTVTGSMVDLTVEVEKPTTAEDINAKLRAAANGELKGILYATDDPIVSTDIVGDSHSSIADLDMTKVIDGTFIKTISWYDNEWGYSSRCVDFFKFLAGQE